jgi:hypothetical protein
MTKAVDTVRELNASDPVEPLHRTPECSGPCFTGWRCIACEAAARYPYISARTRK